MNNQQTGWQSWREYFEARKDRRLPELRDPADYSAVPASVARSLAVFQLGESGGGTIVGQARASRLASINADYADALQLFVAEEHRHAALLAICVRNLGGSLIRQNWTASMFVFARRLIGLRLKVLVLLAAEVVGICYYHLLATRLPAGKIRSLLAQIVNDEHSHLHFHCRFLRGETGSSLRRLAFVAVWRVTMCAAALVVLIDHRRALSDLRIPVNAVWRRWTDCSRLAERLVTGNPIAKNAARDCLGLPPARTRLRYPGARLPRHVRARRCEG